MRILSDEKRYAQTVHPSLRSPSINKKVVPTLSLLDTSLLALCMLRPEKLNFPKPVCLTDFLPVLYQPFVKYLLNLLSRAFLI